MNKWTYTTLGKISEIITGPFGSQLHQSDYVEQGIPVVMPQDIDNRKVNYASINYVSNEDAIRLERYKTIINDILYARRGDVEKHAFIKEKDNGVLCGTGCLRVRITTSEVEPEFISFFLNREETRKWLVTHAVGTNMPNLNTDILSDVPIAYPLLEEQRRIVQVLNSLDEKIALNSAVNDNLEQQAKLLYDYWFTQFDFPDENGEPYRSSGGKMVWNEQLKRTIPDGWTTNPLSDIFTFKSGYSFSSDLYEVSGKYKLLTIKNVQNNGINLNVDNYINVLPDNVPDYCLLKAQDILMSLTGNVGRVGIMYADNCLLNQRVALAEPVNINQRVFVYFLLKSDIIHKQYEMIANGSSQQNLSPIEAEKVIIAYNPEVATKFSTLCNEYLNTIVSNLAENQELINIRDWLLPILMNGQATISD